MRAADAVVQRLTGMLWLNKAVGTLERLLVLGQRRSLLCLPVAVFCFALQTAAVKHRHKNSRRLWIDARTSGVMMTRKRNQEAMVTLQCAVSGG